MEGIQTEQLARCIETLEKSYAMIKSAKINACKIEIYPKL